MASYKIGIKKSAQKEIRKLPDGVRGKIIQKIQELYEQPIPSSAEKIKGLNNVYRLRQGNYRIIYYVFNEKLLISVVRIRHRKEVYRNM